MAQSRRSPAPQSSMRRGRAGAASIALASRMRSAARSGVSMRTASRTLRIRPTSGCARSRSASGGMSSIRSAKQAPNQLAAAASSMTRCSHATLSSPSACSFSRLLSKRRCVSPYQPHATAASALAATTILAFGSPIDRSTPSRCRKNGVGARRPGTAIRASKRTRSAGSTTMIARNVSRMPTPETMPSSRSPWNSVNHARRNTPADVSAPLRLLGTAVRIMCSTDSSTGRRRRAST